MPTDNAAFDESGLPEPYYADDFVTLYHADARDLNLRSDVVVTDPPYGLGIAYGSFTDDDALVKDAAGVVTRLIDSAVVVMVTPGLKNLWAYPQPTAVGCWHIPGNPGRGFPWSNPEWEPILVYTKRLLGGSSVFRAPITNQAGVGSHPCPKPLTLMRKLVATATKNHPSDVVLDPFAGSGTTLRAAKDLGIRAIGIEIEERFCEIAAERMGQEVLDLAV